MTVHFLVSVVWVKISVKSAPIGFGLMGYDTYNVPPPIFTLKIDSEICTQTLALQYLKLQSLLLVVVLHKLPLLPVRLGIKGKGKIFPLQARCGPEGG